ncbi:helix-turn-helix domain-containing protein [Pseudorhodobacter wandonensis]|uniref:helix-turn-helix domain-containing protein n=1 Tax=Pseudorhodobacter wandonensis TaxID=1120568 RepID=UPI000B0EE4DB|nr:helix-turn-helix domain-containing protein [Pseudorhodobacter wandonensis]
MSHKATKWFAGIDPPLLKAGEFRVLFHLCDCHNSNKAPRRACYPSQEKLIEKTALSNAGLNKCLNSLEKAGHFNRVRSTIPGTSTRRTYYILACDFNAETGQTSLSGDSPNSTSVEIGEKQTPLSAGANSTLEGDKLHPSGEEPVRNLKGTKEITDGFSELWNLFPRKRNEARSRKLFLEAVESGVNISRILDGARSYANEVSGTERRYIAGSDSWLEKQRWTEQEGASKLPAPASKFATPAEFYADWVKSGRSVPASAIKANMAREMIGRGLVTKCDLRSVGIFV